MAALRSYRLSSQAQFRQITTRGKYIRASVLSMRWIESPDGICRFCFIAKKKNGNAVYRNRCRRVLRPLFFSKASMLKKPIWAMISVNVKSIEMNADSLRKAGELLIEKLQGKIHD